MKTSILTLAMVGSLVLCGRPAAACTGDCNTDGTVTVDEIIQGVGVALGSNVIGRCLLFDADGNETVTVDEVVLAVNNALLGCPTFSPGEYTASIPLDDEVADITFTADEDGAITGELTLTPIPRSRGGRAAGSGAVTGSVDWNTGRFSFSGSVGGISFSVSGTLPSSRGGGSISINIGGVTYSGSFGSGATPTPTPTTPSGTVHNVKVGQASLPFDPELIEIDPGDTVVWMWVGGTHSVRSALPGTCNPSGLFDSGARSSGTFSHTFNTSGTYEYHCGVGSHCQNFESGIVIVRATPTPTATRTPTVPPTPTATATVNVVDGVSRDILGIFSGEYRNQFGGVFPARLQIQQITGFGMVVVTDIGGFVFGTGHQLTFTAETPTKIVYTNPNPFNMVSIILELVGPGHLTGVHDIVMPGMGTFHNTLDLTREP
jgi:plastocyanin